MRLKNHVAIVTGGGGGLGEGICLCLAEITGQAINVDGGAYLN